MSLSERFNPFPGLRSFEPDEDHLFFGREAQTDELLRRLRSSRFLAVVGTSGSGKSSLVRSGLIPSLHGGAMSGAGSDWRVAILRPGGDPIVNLAEALNAPEALGAAPSPHDRFFLEANLRASRLGLVESVREARLPSGSHLLILVDQFEELFRLRQSGPNARDGALDFVRLLLEAVKDKGGPVYIALTLRSEYIGHCMEFPDLPEKINAGLYLVPRMTREQLRSAIVGPVAVGGGEIELRLVHRLLNDVGDNPDQLPILQHALMRTWDQWEGDPADGKLDLRHYEAVGTMRRALSLHADEAYAELDAAGKRIAEKMFKALTEPGPDGRGVRRPVSVGEVCGLTGAAEAEVLAVVERFLQPGRSFLTLSQGTASRTSSMVDLSHESLIRVWDKLRVWVRQEAGAAREYRDLTGDAHQYASEKGELLGGVKLQVALEWRAHIQPNPVWAFRYDPAYLWTTSFIEESEQEQRRVWRKRQWLRWGGVAFLVLVSLVSLAMWSNAREQKQRAEVQTQRAEVQKKRAEEQKKLAEKAVDEANIARLEALAEKANADAARLEALAEKANADAARLEAEGKKKEADQARIDAFAQKAAAEIARVEAFRQKEAADLARLDAEDKKREAELAKVKAEESEGRAERLKNLAKAYDLAARSLRQEDKEIPRAALLAIQAYRLHRENREGHEQETEDYKDKTDFYRALHSALSRWSEEQARSEGAAKQAAQQGPADPRVSGVWRLDTAVRALTFDGGKTLRVGTEDGSILGLDGRILDSLFQGKPNEPTVPKGIRSFQGGVRSLARGPAEAFAAGSLGGSIVVVKSDAVKPVSKDTPEGWGAVNALAFHRTGWLAAGGADGRVHLWKDDYAKESSPLDPPGEQPLTALAFSQGGKKLAACGTGGLFLWEDFEKPETLTVIRDDNVRAVDLSDDGMLLAMGTVGGKVLLCDFSSGSPSCEMPGSSHGSAVNAVRFNSTGRSLASASGDGTVKLWSVERGSGQAHLDDPPLTLQGHTSWVWSMDFSSDGQWIVSGSQDRTVRFWPTSLEVLEKELCQRLRSSTPAKRGNLPDPSEIEEACKPSPRAEAPSAAR